MNKHYDVIVVGSGPCGLTAAKIAAEGGKRVLVLERNDAASKKIYATGNGHCNFLNKNLKGAEEVLSYCNSIGIIETEQEDGRLYPRNMQASSVAFALLEAARKAGADIICSFKASSVQKNEQGYVVESESGVVYTSEQLVIATGGKAGIQFGCYGDGYKWAEGFGLNVIKPIPALCGLECAEDISALHGVRLFAEVKLLCNDKELSKDNGEVQFTKDSISGICVMNLSRFVRLAEDRKYTLCLDMYPEYSNQDLFNLFMHQKETLGCAMEGLVPEKMHNYLHTKITSDKHNPQGMAKLSKNLCFKITGTKGWKDAQVTSGGVSLEELTENFESKKQKGLFFGGELVDYDGPCGGYNIGFAIKSGMKIGRALSK